MFNIVSSLFGTSYAINTCTQVKYKKNLLMYVQQIRLYRMKLDFRMCKYLFFLQLDKLVNVTVFYFSALPYISYTIVIYDTIWSVTLIVF